MFFNPRFLPKDTKLLTSKFTPLVTCDFPTKWWMKAYIELISGKNSVAFSPYHTKVHGCRINLQSNPELSFAQLFWIMISLIQIKCLFLVLYWEKLVPFPLTYIYLVLIILALLNQFCKHFLNLSLYKLFWLNTFSKDIVWIGFSHGYCESLMDLK